MNGIPSPTITEDSTSCLSPALTRSARHPTVRLSCRDVRNCWPLQIHSAKSVPVFTVFLLSRCLWMGTTDYRASRWLLSGSLVGHLVIRLIGWMVGWLVGWQAGWSSGWLGMCWLVVGWLDGWWFPTLWVVKSIIELANWSVVSQWSLCRTIVRSIGWLVFGRLVSRLVGRSFGWGSGRCGVGLPVSWSSMGWFLQQLMIWLCLADRFLSHLRN